MYPRRYKSYIMLLITAAIWGAAGPIIKYTLGGIDPLPFLTYRLLVSSVVAIIFFAYKLKKGKKFRQLRANFTSAITYGVLAVPIGLGILFFALDKTTVLDMTLVGIIGPLIVTAGGALFFRDHITKREKTGIAIVLAGVLINSLYPLFGSGSEIRLTGNILLLIFLLADSGSMLIAKKIIRNKVKSSNLTNLAFLVGFIVLLPLALIKYGPIGFFTLLANLPLRYHLGVWYMALLSGSLAYYLYVRGQKSIEVSEAALFNYMQPVFMVPLAVLWLHENISMSFLTGAVIITIGLVIAQYKKRAGKL